MQHVPVNRTKITHTIRNICSKKLSSSLKKLKWVWIKQEFRLCYTYTFVCFDIHAARVGKELCGLLNWIVWSWVSEDWMCSQVYVWYSSVVIFVASLSVLLFPVSYLSLGLLWRDSHGKRVTVKIVFMCHHSFIACSILSLAICHPTLLITVHICQFN